MHRIVRILGTERRGDHTITFAILDDGTEASGVGDFEVGQAVMHWYDEQYNKIKMKRGYDDRAKSKED